MPTPPDPERTHPGRSAPAPAGRPGVADQIDARLLLALAESPRATVLALAERVGLSRNTVQARLARLEERGVLRGFERRIDPAALGYPLSAYVTVTVVQRRLAEVADALAAVPEVLEVLGMTGEGDLLVQVVARDADDLYRVAGRLLAIDGVERTTTSLVMRRLVDYRITQLVRALAVPDGAGRPGSVGRPGDPGSADNAARNNA